MGKRAETEAMTAIYTVFIIDDDLSCRSFLSDLLVSNGFRILAAEGGPQALKHLRTGLHTTDLVIVDYSMDKMNGYEFVREFRTTEAGRSTPVIMLTATHKLLRDALQQEGVQFLSKSSSNRQILDAVKAALGGKAPSFQPAKEAPPLQVVHGHRESMSGKPTAEAKLPARRDVTLPPIRPVQSSVTPPPIMTSTPSTPAKAIAERPPIQHVQAARLELKPAPDEPKTAAVEHADAPISSVCEPARNEVEEVEIPLADPTVSQLVDGIIADAVRRQASDIHIEPQREHLQVRIRVDGALQSSTKVAARLAPMVAARIKVLCNLNITERRLPQDGHFSLGQADGRRIEFRVSTLPSTYGETIVMRILRPGQLQVHLSSTFTGRNFEMVRSALMATNGLIVTTGPTGSGKTSTLYSMLETLNTPGRSIVTVEDPVEYQVDGITQVGVNSQIGYTFDRVLRAMLRQDPNIILVGEIRDLETGLIALKASVTGHMVLSTLHTNDAPSSIHRLISMGIPPYLVSAACRLVIAQRLVRTLCPACKIEGTLTQDEACQLANREAQQLQKIWRPKGCPACNGIGFSGRKAIFEIMPVVSHNIRQAIVRQASPDELRELAFAEGMLSLRQEALALVAAGHTSPTEALSILYTA